MVLSEEQRQAKLKTLAESEGFDDIQGLLEAAACDSVSPGICINCDYTCEVEPHQDKGYCEACSGPSVQSALVLAGLI